MEQVIKCIVSKEYQKYWQFSTNTKVSIDFLDIMRIDTHVAITLFEALKVVIQYLAQQGDNFALQAQEKNDLNSVDIQHLKENKTKLLKFL